MKKVVVYTAVSGSYDSIHKLSCRNEDFDYVCFSDQPVDEIRGWNVRPFEYENDDPVRTAKHPKILPHLYFSEYQYSVWVDGHVDIHGNIEELIDKMEEKGAVFSAFKHFCRNCVVDEGEACIQAKRDDTALISAQLDLYRRNGFLDDQGLLSGGVMIRKHNDDSCMRFMDAWWGQIDQWSRRDQLSFSYVRWKFPVEIFWIAGTIGDNDWFCVFLHSHQKDIAYRFNRRIKAILGLERIRHKNKIIWCVPGSRQSLRMHDQLRRNGYKSYLLFKPSSKIGLFFPGIVNVLLRCCLKMGDVLVFGNWEEHPIRSSEVRKLDKLRSAGVRLVYASTDPSLYPVETGWSDCVLFLQQDEMDGMIEGNSKTLDEKVEVDASMEISVSAGMEYSSSELAHWINILGLDQRHLSTFEQTRESLFPCF